MVLRKFWSDLKIWEMSVIIVLKFCFSAFLSIRSLEIMMVSQHPGKYRILPSIFPDAGILVKVKKKHQKKRRISLWYSYYITEWVGKRGHLFYGRNFPNTENCQSREDLLLCFWTTPDMAAFLCCWMNLSLSMHKSIFKVSYTNKMSVTRR